MILFTPTQPVAFDTLVCGQVFQTTEGPDYYIKVYIAGRPTAIHLSSGTELIVEDLALPTIPNYLHVKENK